MRLMLLTMGRFFTAGAVEMSCFCEEPSMLFKTQSGATMMAPATTNKEMNSEMAAGVLSRPGSWCAKCPCLSSPMTRLVVCLMWLRASAWLELWSNSPARSWRPKTSAETRSLRQLGSKRWSRRAVSIASGV